MRILFEKCGLVVSYCMSTGAPLARSRYKQGDGVVVIVVPEHFVWVVASTESVRGILQDLREG